MRAKDDRRSSPWTTKASLGLMQVLEYSRSVYLSHGTWSYVTRAAEYYYYTTTLVKPFTN